LPLIAPIKKFNKTSQVLFKHSTRCNVSGITLKRVENAGTTPGSDFYFIYLVSFGKIFDKISEF
jgi:monothiol bacilliredoxin